MRKRRFALQIRARESGWRFGEKPVISRMVSLGAFLNEIKPGMVFALETFWFGLRRMDGARRGLRKKLWSRKPGMK